MVEFTTVVGEVRTRLRGGVLSEGGREGRGTGRVEDHYSETMRRVVHRCGSDGAIENLLNGSSGQFHVSRLQVTTERAQRTV